jgi:hypothetical protein
MEALSSNSSTAKKKKKKKKEKPRKPRSVTSLQKYDHRPSHRAELKSAKLGEK